MSYRPNQRSTPEGAKVNGRYLYIFWRSLVTTFCRDDIYRSSLAQLPYFLLFYKIREYFLDLCAACAYNGYKSKQ